MTHRSPMVPECVDFSALVAAVVRDRGWVLTVAVLRVELEELWCWLPQAVIVSTAALPYLPGYRG